MEITVSIRSAIPLKQLSKCLDRSIKMLADSRNDEQAP
jgi:hypothetical protein